METLKLLLLLFNRSKDKFIRPLCSGNGRRRMRRHTDTEIQPASRDTPDRNALQFTREIRQQKLFERLYG